MEKEKNFIIIFLIIVVIGFGIYFSSEKNSDNLSVSQQLQLSQKCSEDGKNWFSEYRQKMYSSLNKELWDDPQYHYSKSLNTCLVYSRYIIINTASAFHYNQITDIYSNKPIIDGYFSRDVSVNPPTEELSDTFDDTPNYTSDDFFQKKDLIFNQ